MNIGRVIERLQTDAAYAESMRAKVSKLSSDGKTAGPHKADLWNDILADFAESPEELARLSQANTLSDGSTTWTTTVTTVSCTVLTVTGAPVTVTTMTTMTTVQMKEM